MSAAAAGKRDRMMRGSPWGSRPGRRRGAGSSSETKTLAKGRRPGASRRAAPDAAGDRATIPALLAHAGTHVAGGVVLPASAPPPQEATEMIVGVPAAVRKDE